MREIDITKQDIRCCDELTIENNKTINATYELWFEVDKYFGTKIRDTENWINFYTDWHEDGNVTAVYVLNGPDTSESYEWTLTEEEKEFFRGLMESYCQDKYGCKLFELLRNDI